jgi:adenylosuccinate lyase
MNNLDFSTYISPFTWRYGSTEMRHVFSEEHKYQIWRNIWVALAETQQKAGLVSKKELDDLKKNQNNIDISRAHEIEKESKQDVDAAIKEFASKTKIGGGKIHLGATSMDIVDNTDTIRMKEALEIIFTEGKEKAMSLCN